MFLLRRKSKMAKSTEVIGSYNTVWHKNDESRDDKAEMHENDWYISIGRQNLGDEKEK